MNNDAVLLMSDDGVNFGEPIAVMVKDAMIHVFGQREKILGWAAHVHRSYQDVYHPEEFFLSIIFILMEEAI